MDNTIVTLIYGFIAGGATIVGIWVVIFNEALGKRYESFFMTFAAGVILAVSFLHLMPEALELNEKAIFYVFLGFLSFYMLESYFFIHSGPEFQHIEHFNHTRISVIAKVAFWGLLVHSLLDGITIGIGFEVDKTLGIFTALSIILHELPEGIATFSILILSHDRRRALHKSYIVALATPLGAVFSLLFIKSITEDVVGLLLSLVAGSFIYVAASDLIPATHTEKGFKNVFVLLSGVFMIYIFSLIT